MEQADSADLGVFVVARAALTKAASDRAAELTRQRAEEAARLQRERERAEEAAQRERQRAEEAAQRARQSQQRIAQRQAQHRRRAAGEAVGNFFGLIFAVALLAGGLWLFVSCGSVLGSGGGEVDQDSPSFMEAERRENEEAQQAFSKCYSDARAAGASSADAARWCG